MPPRNSRCAICVARFPQTCSWSSTPKNPERDFQKQYYEEVWKTVEETKIVEKALKIATSRMSQDNLDKAKAVLQEVKEAAAAIDVEAIMNSKELVYSQLLQVGRNGAPRDHRLATSLPGAT